MIINISRIPDRIIKAVIDYLSFIFLAVLLVLLFVAHYYPEVINLELCEQFQAIFFLGTLGVFLSSLKILLTVREILDNTINQKLSISRIDHSLDGVRSVVNNSTATKVITKTDFYSRLGESVANAKKSLRLTYLGCSPGYSTNEIMEEYFNNLSRIIKLNPNLLVRRIVDIESYEKFEWVSKWINEFESCDNFSMRISKNMPISVQIIDDSECYVVDMMYGAHSPDGIEKDVWITDQKVVEQLSRYYDRQWRLSKKLKIGKKIFRGNLKDKWYKIT